MEKTGVSGAEMSDNRIRALLGEIHAELGYLHEFLDGNPSVLAVTHIYELLSSLMLEVGIVTSESTEDGQTELIEVGRGD